MLAACGRKTALGRTMCERKPTLHGGARERKSGRALFDFRPRSARTVEEERDREQQANDPNVFAVCGDHGRLVGVRVVNDCHEAEDEKADKIKRNQTKERERAANQAWISCAFPVGAVVVCAEHGRAPRVRSGRKREKTATSHESRLRTHSGVRPQASGVISSKLIRGPGRGGFQI